MEIAYWAYTLFMQEEPDTTKKKVVTGWLVVQRGTWPPYRIHHVSRGRDLDSERSSGGRTLHFIVQGPAAQAQHA